VEQFPGQDKEDIEFYCVRVVLFMAGSGVVKLLIFN